MDAGYGLNGVEHIAWTLDGPRYSEPKLLNDVEDGCRYGLDGAEHIA